MFKPQSRPILLLISIFCVAISIGGGIARYTRLPVTIILNQASELRDCSTVFVSLNNVDIIDTVTVCNDELLFMPSFSGFSSTSYLPLNTLSLRVFDEGGKKLDHKVFDVKFSIYKCIKIFWFENKAGEFNYDFTKDFPCDGITIEPF